jgi:hypothetical protein
VKKSLGWEEKNSNNIQRNSRTAKKAKLPTKKRTEKRKRLKGPKPPKN